MDKFNSTLLASGGDGKGSEATSCQSVPQSFPADRRKWELKSCVLTALMI